MLKKVIEIAFEAGKKILEIYESNEFDVSIKSDSSPLTKADLISNQIILDGLKKISNYPIISEEAQVDFKKRKNWDKFWLVDPLDGTKDFIAKNDQYTINIALIKDHKPILGLIYAPALDLLYYAEKGKGSYVNNSKIYNNSKRINLIGTDSNFHSTNETKEFFKKFDIKIIKKFGSAIKYGKLAEGVIDIYPRYNGTKEWDTAAGQIILNEAGCKMIDIITKQEILYNKENIKNNYFIASREDLNFL